MNRLLKIFAIVVVSFALVFYFGCLIYYNSRNLQQHKVIPSILAATVQKEIRWIPVTWRIGSFSDRGAMYLPVWLDSIAKPFWMQFDLGTPYTDLYPISHYLPYLKGKEQQLQRLSFHQDRPLYYTGIHLNVGNVLPYRATAVPIYDRLQADSLVETGERYDTKIGNLGYDLIINRILLLDYKNSRMAITESLPAHLSITYFSSAQVSHFPIFLPVTIDGREKLAQFDNGSSAFTFIAEKKDWKEWRDPLKKTDTMTGSSWGKKEFYYRATPAVAIRIAGRDVSHQPIWTISRWQEQEGSVLRRIKQFTDRRFGKTFAGIIGNEYFRNDILVLDARNNRAGIVDR